MKIRTAEKHAMEALYDEADREPENWMVAGMRFSRAVCHDDPRFEIITMRMPNDSILGRPPVELERTALGAAEAIRQFCQGFMAGLEQLDQEALLEGGSSRQKLGSGES